MVKVLFASFVFNVLLFDLIACWLEHFWIFVVFSLVLAYETLMVDLCVCLFKPKKPGSIPREQTLEMQRSSLSLY